MFTKSVTLSVTVLKTGVVLHRPWTKSKWTLLPYPQGLGWGKFSNF